VIGASLLTLIGLAYLIYYAISHHPKPSDVAVPTVLFIRLGALVVLLAPWRDLGLIPTEIGGVKFERIVKAEKKEQIDAIVPLQEELKALKAKLEVLSRVVGVSSPGLLEEQEKQAGAEAARLAPSLNEKGGRVPDPARPEQLKALLVTFFRRHRGTFFSPIRIQQWGSRQKEFSDFKHYSIDEIREVLFKAVADDEIDTNISKKGKTLYGLSTRSGRG
jgi:hypothetical protein